MRDCSGYSRGQNLRSFLFQLKRKIPKTIRGRGNPVGDFGPLVLGSRLLEFRGLASGFEIVGSNPGQPTVAHFLHFAVGSTARARFCFFFTKAIDGTPRLGLVEGPRQHICGEIAFWRRAMSPARATPMSHFGASSTIAARKPALRAYFERRTPAKTPNATPLGG